MVVQHNISAMNANRYYGINNSGLSKSLEKLSSGYAINRAGDNAAGLAVSEKMRSQIGGLTQAVKNAQDGISMIQTFEGALTETDSILQRMKTLANQAANGTYQDDVDRDAIQLEFDQLNDELNQIADTDFNGVVVLNGGRMADGLNQVDGKFDYANRETSDAANIAELQKQIDDLKASAPRDIFKTSEYNTIDENKYGLDQAKALWDKAKLDLSPENDKYVDVTYTAKVDDDGVVTYEVTNAVTDSGKDLMDKKDLFSATAVNEDATGNATGKGGFTVDGDTDAEVNVIFDASKVKTGDVITVRYNGPGVSPKAPANAGVANDSIVYTKAGTNNAQGTGVPEVTVKYTDAKMTEDMVKVFDALNGAEVTLTGTAATGSIAAITGFALKDGEGNSVTIAATGEFTLAGQKMIAEFASDKITVSLGTTASKGDAVFELNIADVFDKTATTGVATGDKVAFNLAFDSYQAPAGTGVDAEAVETKGVGDANIEKQIERLTDKLTKLQEKTGVSNSDAFDNGAIPMTYTDHIILQSGARSKDAVDFTFKYSCGGMGDLKANMNCSARADGLNTENLYLTTAKDANYAIDRIDHAINKVSMVRATFGAVQNRLEHKIDNMNVTKENITSAESRIRDTNMAEEMSNFTRNQILSQASQSMLAQANSLPQSVLQLLG